MSKKLRTFGNYGFVVNDGRDFCVVNAFSYGAHMAEFSIFFKGKPEDDETKAFLFVTPETVNYSKTSKRHFNRFLEMVAIAFKVNIDMTDERLMHYKVTLSEGFTDDDRAHTID